MSNSIYGIINPNGQLFAVAKDKRRLQAVITGILPIGDKIDIRTYDPKSRINEIATDENGGTYRYLTLDKPSRFVLIIGVEDAYIALDDYKAPQHFIDSALLESNTFDNLLSLGAIDQIANKVDSMSDELSASSHTAIHGLIEDEGTGNDIHLILIDTNRIEGGDDADDFASVLVTPDRQMAMIVTNPNEIGDRPQIVASGNMDATLGDDFDRQYVKREINRHVKLMTDQPKINFATTNIVMPYHEEYDETWNLITMRVDPKAYAVLYTCDHAINAVTGPDRAGMRDKVEKNLIESETLPRQISLGKASHLIDNVSFNEPLSWFNTKTDRTKQNLLLVNIAPEYWAEK